jgi:hypothetical protein
MISLEELELILQLKRVCSNAARHWRHDASMDDDSSAYNSGVEGLRKKSMLVVLHSMMAMLQRTLRKVPLEIVKAVSSFLIENSGRR